MDYNLQGKPPDGGYGWIVMLCSMLAQCVFASTILGNSILMVEYGETFGVSKAVGSLPGATATFVNGMASICVGSLIHRYDARRLCMIGAVVGSCSLLSTSFAPNIYTICATYGILGGIAQSCVSVSSFVVVQQYFDSRRAFAAGISSIGQSLASASTGPIYTVLIYHYGWRGAVLIYAGVYLQAVVLGASYRPLARPKVKNKPVGSGSLGETTQDNEKKGNTLFCSCLDVTVLKDKVFVLYLLGVFLYMLGIMVMVQFYPSRAVHIGMTKMQAGMALSCMGLLSAVSRFTNSFIANMRCTNRVLQIGLVTVYGGVISCLTNLCTTSLTTFLAAGLFGISIGMYGAIQHTVLIDLVGRERIAKVIGLLTSVQGVANVLSLPLAGWLFDLTKSFEVSFFFAGSLQMLSGTIMITVFFLKKRGNRRESLQTEALQNMPMVRMRIRSPSLEK